MSAQEQTLVQIAARLNDTVECRCMIFTGLRTCVCEDPVENLAQEIYAEQNRVKTWDQCDENFRNMLRHQARGRIAGFGRT